MIAPNLSDVQDVNDIDAQSQQSTTLPFPPLTRTHILNCAYNSWWPRYRSFVPKSRLIALTQPFIDYLQADGIYLPADGEDTHPGFEDEDIEVVQDVARNWRSLHEQIKATIKELGGKVHPKLNWSSPKDATHMLGNSMNCYSADDVYLLLKSSDFITFDLNHAFDDTVDDTINLASVPWHLVLRKSFNVNPSVEFRCFVKGYRLVGATQRDMNYYSFLHQEKDRFLALIQDFFEAKLRDTFTEQNFVFDVYIPDPFTKVWLIDINPWAQRTDPLLFSWLELLTMEAPVGSEPDRLRLHLGGANTSSGQVLCAVNCDDQEHGSGDSSSDFAEELFVPELRLLNKDDPESYSFTSPQYSAHKMPKDVVDAAANGSTNALRELSLEWKQALERAQNTDIAGDVDDTD